MALSEEQAALIPEEIRNDPALQSFNDLGGVARSFIETKKMVGGSIRIPDEKATPEDSQKWWGETKSKLAERGFIESTPASPDKYEWKFEGAQPEEIANDKVLAKFAPIAHELGLSNRQANALVEKFGKDILPDMMPQPQFADAKELSSKAFGGKADEEIENYKRAMAGLQQDDPELTEIIKDDRPRLPDGKFVHMFDHPAFIRLINKAFSMRPDFGGNKGGGIAGETLDTINTQIADLRADTKLPSEEIGKRLEALYKKKTILMGANGR